MASIYFSNFTTSLNSYRFPNSCFCFDTHSVTRVFALSFGRRLSRPSNKHFSPSRSATLNFDCSISLIIFVTRRQRRLSATYKNLLYRRVAVLLSLRPIGFILYTNSAKSRFYATNRMYGGTTQYLQ